MNAQRARLRPLYIPQRKHVDFEPPPHIGGGKLGNRVGHLSPDLQPSTPPTFPEKNVDRVTKIGRYLLLEQVDTCGDIRIHRSLHLETQERFITKVGEF